MTQREEQWSDLVYLGIFDVPVVVQLIDGNRTLACALVALRRWRTHALKLGDTGKKGFTKSFDMLVL